MSMSVFRLTRIISRLLADNAKMCPTDRSNEIINLNTYAIEIIKQNMKIEEELKKLKNDIYKLQSYRPSRTYINNNK